MYKICMYSRSKKKKNTPTNFYVNYRREMKLAPINMDYCLLQSDALKFFRLNGVVSITYKIELTDSHLPLMVRRPICQLQSPKCL